MTCRLLSLSSEAMWPELLRFLENRDNPDQTVETDVRAMLDAVRKGGDSAVLEYVRRFDCPDMRPPRRVPAEDLEQAARDHGVTLNTVLQVAWALAVQYETGRDDVVFGTVVSGRSAAIAHIDRTVGLLINTVPVRVRLRPGDALRDTLHRVRDEQTRLAEHQHLGLAEIQQVCGVETLFDTLLVFEHPLDLTDADDDGSLEMRAVQEPDAPRCAIKCSALVRCVCRHSAREHPVVHHSSSSDNPYWWENGSRGSRTSSGR